MNDEELDNTLSLKATEMRKALEDNLDKEDDFQSKASHDSREKEVTDIGKLKQAESKDFEHKANIHANIDMRKVQICKQKLMHWIRRQKKTMKRKQRHGKGTSICNASCQKRSSTKKQLQKSDCVTLRKSFVWSTKKPTNVMMI